VQSTDNTLGIFSSRCVRWAFVWEQMSEWDYCLRFEMIDVILVGHLLLLMLRSL
jgi:hypothetical protein